MTSDARTPYPLDERTAERRRHRQIDARLCWTRDVDEAQTLYDLVAAPTPISGDDHPVLDLDSRARIWDAIRTEINPGAVKSAGKHYHDALMLAYTEHISSRIASIQDALTRQALTELAAAPCERLTSWPRESCATDPALSPNAPYLADRYCWPCRLRHALSHPDTPTDPDTPPDHPAHATAPHSGDQPQPPAQPRGDTSPTRTDVGRMSVGSRARARVGRFGRAVGWALLDVVEEIPVILRDPAWWALVAFVSVTVVVVALVNA